MTANESILLPLYQNESAIMMVTCTNLCCFPSKTIQQLQWQLTQLTQFFCCFLFKMAQQLRWQLKQLTQPFAASCPRQPSSYGGNSRQLHASADCCVHSKGTYQVDCKFYSSFWGRTNIFRHPQRLSLNNLIISFVSFSKLIAKFISTLKSLFLLCNKDNSEIMNPRLLLFLSKTLQKLWQHILLTSHFSWLLSHFLQEPNKPPFAMIPSS